MARRFKVSVRIEEIAESIAASGRRYVSVKELARQLGTSSRSAGRLLAELERAGLAKRYSRRTYEILAQPTPRARRQPSSG